MFDIVARRVSELQRMRVRCIGLVVARDLVPVDLYAYDCDEIDFALAAALQAGYMLGLGGFESRDVAARLGRNVPSAFVKRFVEDIVARRAREKNVRVDVSDVARSLLEDPAFYHSVKPAVVEVAARAVARVLHRLGLLGVGERGGDVRISAGVHGVYHT